MKGNPSAVKKSKTKTSSKTNSTSAKPAHEPEGLSNAAECLRTLGHPARLRMVQLLLHGRFTVGELAADCGIPDNVASEHLRLMQRCGFFTSQREGRKVFYQVAEPHLEGLMACIKGRFLSNAGR